MSDVILIDQDTVMFMPSFGAAIVVVQPGQLKATGKATVGGKKVAIDGDEKQVQVAGCMYTAPPFIIPGTGTLKIDALAGDQKAQHSTVGGTAVLLKGGNFTAKFEVQTKAQQPTPGGPVPDATPSYSGGQGNFVSTNSKVMGT